jgi:hypothetical protein
MTTPFIENILAAMDAAEAPIDRLKRSVRLVEARMTDEVGAR